METSAWIQKLIMMLEITKFVLLHMALNLGVAAETTSFVCPPEKGFYPNSENCRTFYSCEDGIATLRFCPSDLYYNSAKKTCDYPGLASCFKGGTSVAVSESGESSSDIICDRLCSCIHPSATDCAEYYRCENGIAYKEKCSFGLLMNADLLVCDYEENVVCNISSPTPKDAATVTAIVVEKLLENYSQEKVIPVSAVLPGMLFPSDINTRLQDENLNTVETQELNITKELIYTNTLPSQEKFTLLENSSTSVEKPLFSKTANENVNSLNATTSGISEQNFSSAPDILSNISEHKINSSAITDTFVTNTLPGLNITSDKQDIPHNASNIQTSTNSLVPNSSEEENKEKTSVKSFDTSKTEESHLNRISVNDSNGTEVTSTISISNSNVEKSSAKTNIGNSSEGYTDSSDYKITFLNDSAAVNEREYTEFTTTEDFDPAYNERYILVNFTCTISNGSYAINGKCTSHASCINGVAYEKQCPGLTHYSEEVGKCVNPCRAKCDPNIDCNTNLTENINNNRTFVPITSLTYEEIATNDEKDVALKMSSQTEMRNWPTYSYSDSLITLETKYFATKEEIVNVTVNDVLTNEENKKSIYNKVLFTKDSSLFNNPVTNLTTAILDFDGSKGATFSENDINETIILPIVKNVSETEYLFTKQQLLLGDLTTPEENTFGKNVNTVNISFTASNVEENFEQFSKDSENATWSNEISSSGVSAKKLLDATAQQIIPYTDGLTFFETSIPNVSSESSKNEIETIAQSIGTENKAETTSINEITKISKIASQEPFSFINSTIYFREGTDEFVTIPTSKITEVNSEHLKKEQQNKEITKSVSVTKESKPVTGFQQQETSSLIKKLTNISLLETKATVSANSEMPLNNSKFSIYPEPTEIAKTDFLNLKTVTSNEITDETKVSSTFEQEETVIFNNITENTSESLSPEAEEITNLVDNETTKITADVKSTSTDLKFNFTPSSSVSATENSVENYSLPVVTYKVTSIKDENIETFPDLPNSTSNTLILTFDKTFQDHSSFYEKLTTLSPRKKQTEGPFNYSTLFDTNSDFGETTETFHVGESKTFQEIWHSEPVSSSSDLTDSTITASNITATKMRKPVSLPDINQTSLDLATFTINVINETQPKIYSSTEVSNAETTPIILPENASLATVVLPQNETTKIVKVVTLKEPIRKSTTNEFLSISDLTNVSQKTDSTSQKDRIITTTDFLVASDMNIATSTFVTNNELSTSNNKQYVSENFSVSLEKETFPFSATNYDFITSPFTFSEKEQNFSKINVKEVSSIIQTTVQNVTVADASTSERATEFPKFILSSTTIFNELMANKTVCSQTEELIPVVDDCTSFYWCYQNHAYLMKCPQDLHFSRLTRHCEYPCNANCDLSLDCNGTKTSTEKPACPDTDGLFPVKDDCNKYLTCLDGIPHIEECPGGLHFNPSTRVCDWPAKASCGENSTNLPVPNVKIECDCQNCLQSVKNDCSKYILCLNQSGYLMDCSEDLLFDSKLNTCNHASKVHCTNALFTTPEPGFTCLEADGLFKNLTDCESFIKCSNFSSHSMKCPMGTHFSEKTSKCEDPCEAQCDKSLECKITTKKPEENDPICTCKNCLLPSHVSCTFFYDCRNGKPSKKRCFYGQVFDSKRKRCDWAHRVRCQSTEMCPKRNGIFPHKDNCQKFIRCSNGIPYVKSCPNRFEFNAHHNRCEWPSGNCGTHGSLQITKTPTSGLDACKSSHKLAEDPYDFRCFYRCTHHNKVLHSCCSKNRIFNAELKRCVWPQRTFHKG